VQLGLQNWSLPLEIVLLFSFSPKKRLLNLELPATSSVSKAD